MSTDQINVAIAELCGWTDIREQDYYASPSDPENIRQFWEGISPEGEKLPLPDYHGSLDAMAQAEATLTATEQIDYARKMHLFFDGQRHHLHIDFDCITATAAQRAEAFLRVKGRWP